MAGWCTTSWGLWQGEEHPWTEPARLLKGKLVYGAVDLEVAFARTDTKRKAKSKEQ